MILCLIGHRGVGKTTFLDRLETLLPGGRFFDLDREIEKASQRKISEIFITEGEASFREKEKQVFEKILEDDPQGEMKVIALGAGFQFSLPPHARVIWLRRPTDETPKIFPDRPGFSDLETRWRSRTKNYADQSDLVLSLPEGDFAPLDFVLRWLNRNSQLEVGGCFTLTPTHFKKTWILQQIFNWKCDLYELRNDLLSEKQISEVYSLLPRQRALLSYRQKPREMFEGVLSDWALEIGKPPQDMGGILSLHDESFGWAESLKKLEQEGKDFSHLKFCPEVKTLKELKEGHEWWREDPTRRNFLPRSKDGRWKWYRLFQKGKMKLNFFSEPLTGVADQPTFREYFLAPDRPSRWAAILGSPVGHSYTPSFHYRFFAAANVLATSFPCEKDDISNEALNILKELGLRFAAVTSPLKEALVPFVESEDSFVSSARTLNTLVFEKEKVKAWNTDRAAAEKLYSHLKGPVVIWGGGGILPVIKTALPMACAYSSRTGGVKETSGKILESPTHLIWAAPEKGETTMPPKEWRPRVVWDLSYLSATRARVYAKSVGADYESGLEFFTEQAKLQQKIWEKYL